MSSGSKDARWSRIRACWALAGRLVVSSRILGAGWQGGMVAGGQPGWVGCLAGGWEPILVLASGHLPTALPLSPIQSTYCSLAREQEPLLEFPGGSAIRRFNFPSSGTCFDSVTSGRDCDSISVCAPVSLRSCGAPAPGPQSPCTQGCRRMWGGWEGSSSFYCVFDSVSTSPDCTEAAAPVPPHHRTRLRPVHGFHIRSAWMLCDSKRSNATWFASWGSGLHVRAFVDK